MSSHRRTPSTLIILYTILGSMKARRPRWVLHNPGWPFLGIVFSAALTLSILLALPRPLAAEGQEVEFSQLVYAVKLGQIEKIVVNGDKLKVRMIDGRSFESRKEPGASLAENFRSFGVSEEQLGALSISIEEPSSLGSWLGPLLWILPSILILSVFMLMFRRPSGAPDQPFPFMKSPAKRVNMVRPTVTLDDVAGVEEAKQEVVEVIEFLKHPTKFRSLGARVPRGLLLVGPPGTGKTLLARAIAGEAGVPFFNISGSEFVELFVGVGAMRVRDLFEQARRSAPCIVFVDEIDAVGRQRGTGMGGGHDEREQTLNQILVEMDGFDQHISIIVLAATNRPDVLDPALLRPGRFDRRIVLDPPDIRGREDILRVHCKGKPMEGNIDLQVIAKQTSGFSGADLENVVNEGAMLAARRGKQTIGMSEMEEAIDRVIAGPQRKSRIISDWEKSITAFHEAGHALVAYMLPKAPPVHKISIVARGRTGGHTRLLPNDDLRLSTKNQLKDIMAFALGGHAAEELEFGEVTTGPENDLHQATSMARKMILEYGMSERLGPVVFGTADGFTFLGRDLGEPRAYSENTADKIDHEIQGLIAEARQRAKTILTQHREKLRKIALALMERETILGEDLLDLCGPPPPLD